MTMVLILPGAKAAERLKLMKAKKNGQFKLFVSLKSE